jgi:hypothetical protein
VTEDQPDPQRFVRRYESILARVRHVMRNMMSLEEQIEAEISEAKRETETEENL